MSEESELREKLKNYSNQLKVIEDRLSENPENDPENEVYKKLRNDLLEVMALTRTLIKKQESQSEDAILNIRKDAEIVHKPKVEVDEKSWYPSVGDACEAIYDNKWYPVSVTASSEQNFTVKFYTFGNEENVPLTNLRPLQNVAEIPIQMNQVQIDQQYQALFSADRKWYDAKVTGIHSRGVTVTYTQYGNNEEVPFEWLRISLKKKKEKKGGDSEKSSDDVEKETNVSRGNGELKFIKIPEYLKVKSSDSEAERKRKKKKLNLIHKKNKRTKVTLERKKQQNSWLKFQKKVSGKRMRRTSIFRTKESKKHRQE